MIADLRLALRSLARARLTSLVATLALGLGIGATVTVFSVFDAVWLEPLPYDEPDRLVALRLRNTHGQETGMSYPNFVDLRDRASSFETLSAFNLAELNVIRDGRPELTDAHQVLGDVFDLIGVDAAIGRGLVPSDDARDAPPVIVLAHDYWTHALRRRPRRRGHHGHGGRGELSERAENGLHDRGRHAERGLVSTPDRRVDTFSVEGGGAQRP